MPAAQPQCEKPDIRSCVVGICLVPVRRIAAADAGAVVYCICGPARRPDRGTSPGRILDLERYRRGDRARRVEKYPGLFDK